MNKKLDMALHPFLYVGGWWSVLWGVLIIAASAVVCSFSGVHFPDVVSVKIGVSLTVEALLLQALISWIVVSMLFYIAGRIFSVSRPRIRDVVGTQGIARFPYLLASFTGFSGALEIFGKYLIWTQLKAGAPVQISSSEILIAIILLIIQVLLTIWMIAWMYQAFSISANLKGGKGAAVFTVSLIVSVIISAIVISAVFPWLMTL